VCGPGMLKSVTGFADQLYSAANLRSCADEFASARECVSDWVAAGQNLTNDMHSSVATSSAKNGRRV